MTKNKQSKSKQSKRVENMSLRALLAGVLLGSLAGALTGAVAMLLLAPQSGRKTRKKIQKKGESMRNHTIESIDEGVAQVRGKAHNVSVGLHKQVDDLQQRGHDMVEDLQKRGHDAMDEQKERWAPVVDASKTAVNGS